MTARALVVGAGPAGLSAALQLKTWVDDVHVAEASSREGFCSVGEHLPPAALKLLCALGLGRLLENPAHTRSSGVSSAWGTDSWADRDYFFSAAGKGINLRRPVFDAALMRHAEDHGVALLHDTRLVGLSQSTGGFSANLREPDTKTTERYDVVVDATGRQARAARMLGASVKRFDRLIGVVGRVTGAPAQSDAGRLFIEAVEQGWWYAVQFENGDIVTVFMTDADLLPDCGGSARDAWHQGLRQSRRLAALLEIGNLPTGVEVFTAMTQQTIAPNLEGFIAVGDAAYAFDPLSSWGIAKGLSDGHAGAAALKAHALGDVSAVSAFSDERHVSFSNYLAQYSDFYLSEMRWPDAPFWHRRHMELT